MTNLSKLIESVERNKTRTDALAKVNTNSVVRLNNKYLNKALATKKINMVIMGQDPYPFEATEFPILKKSLSETLGTSIGKRASELIIKKLNINLPVIEKVPADLPFRIAICLLQKGVLLLNSKYWVVTSNDNLCKKSRELNEYILENVIKKSKEKTIDIHCFGEKSIKTIAFILKEAQEKFYENAKKAKKIQRSYHSKFLIIHLHSNK